MNHLKLIVKNFNSLAERKSYFFNKSELKIILSFYSRMVSKCFWKDYGSYEARTKDVTSILTILVPFMSILRRRHCRHNDAINDDK